MTDDIKVSYEQLKKKYNLPQYDFMENEFEIFLIESKTHLIKHIRKKMIEKVELLIKVVGGVLEPEPAFNEVYESKEFSEKSKKDLFEIYKKLMFYYRRGIHLMILEDEKMDADYINEVSKEWPKLKQSVSKFMTSLENAWVNDIDSDDDLRYLG